MQPERLGDSVVFVLPNPSGRNANFTYAEMLASFRALRRYLGAADRKGPPRVNRGWMTSSSVMNQRSARGFTHALAISPGTSMAAKMYSVMLLGERPRHADIALIFPDIVHDHRSDDAGR
jgi:hypothetical protein